MDLLVLDFQACIVLERSPAFNTAMLVIIAINTVLMGLTDYRNVDLQTGNLQPKGWQNTLIINTEELFLTVYSIELAVKVVALGLFAGKAAYLKVIF